MKIVVLIAAVAAALTATGHADAQHYVPHKPFGAMSTAQKERWLERQAAHANGAATWLDRHLESARRSRRAVETTSVGVLGRDRMLTRWRVERHWFRTSYRIASRHLDEIRRSLAASAAAAESWAEFTCIHEHEGATDANTGNGYYGGLQMDLGFQQTYGPEFLAAYGTADNWPISAQVTAARRARDSGRGYGPWPNTARACGQL